MARAKSTKTRSSIPNSKWTVKEIKGWIRERTKEVQKQVKEFESLEKKGREGLFFRKSVKELQKIATGKERKDLKVPLGDLTKKSDLLAQAKKLSAFGKRKSTRQVGRKVDIEKAYNDLTENHKRIAKERNLRETVNSGRELFDAVQYWEELEDIENYSRDNRDLDEDSSTIHNQRSYEEAEKEYNRYDSDYKDSIVEEPFENEKTERAYQTFKERYDQSLTRDEYQQLLDIFGAIGNYMGSFGYERDLGDSKSVENITMTGNLIDYVKDKEKEGNNVMSVYWAAKEAIANAEGKGWTPMQIMQELDRILNPDD